MAHECCICGSECYCNGSLDDIICDHTPKFCEGCDNCQEDSSCNDFDENDWYEDEEKSSNSAWNLFRRRWEFPKKALRMFFK